MQQRNGQQLPALRIQTSPQRIHSYASIHLPQILTRNVDPPSISRVHDEPLSSSSSVPLTLDGVFSRVTSMVEPSGSEQTPSTQLLLQPRAGTHTARHTHVGDLPTNSLRRFEQERDRDGPWNLYRVTAVPQEPTIRSTEPNSAFSLDSSVLLEGVNRNSTRSEIGSTATEIPPSDSGYASKSRATISVVSGEVPETHRDCGSISSEARSWRNSHTGEGFSLLPEHLCQQVSSPHFEIQDETFPCNYCENTFRCGSDLKYV